MASSEESKEIRKFEVLIKEVISRTVDIWEVGEGDLQIEIRDDKGDKKAKLKGGPVTRIA